LEIKNHRDYQQARRELTDLNNAALRAEREGDYKREGKLQKEAAVISLAMVEYISIP
jgi:hypothetical protein